MAASTLGGTVIPFLIQDRPVLKWSWEKFGPTVISRIEDRANDTINPQKDPCDV